MPTKKHWRRTGRSSPRSTLRRAETERQLRAKAAELGASLGPEPDVAPLLDEVTALVEQPSVYVGEFEPIFSTCRRNA